MDTTLLDRGMGPRGDDMVVPIDPTILKGIKADGLLREGHFAFRSGRHAQWLLDRDRLLADPEFASHLGYLLAKHYFVDKIDTVASPSIWGAGLAQWIAYFLEPKAKVISATPIDGEITVAPGLEGHIRGRRVLLVDNIIITGITLGRFSDRLEAMDATIVGVCTLWNSGADELHGYPVYGVLNSMNPAFAPGDCPLCASGPLPAEVVPY